ncbi:hypothetical protein ALO90_200160 [Pseudomonas amygdali pv. aesculi]|nr:hypothetical protein ALO90_200160 [Pseudomonas amygdali pv. aesculi]
MKELLDSFKKHYDPVHRDYWTDVLTDSELAQWQQQQLRKVVDHVKRTSPFYGKHLAQFEAHTLTLDDLPRLPFTTKDDLREAGFDILSGPLEEAIFYYETTGTTGPATPCPRDAKESYASNQQSATGNGLPGRDREALSRRENRGRHHGADRGTFIRRHAR